MTQIPLDEYKKVIEVLPILCVDVALQNSRGEYLLVKRVNEPKKNQWWVVGGRVLKGETLEGAVIRKVKEETGAVVSTMQPIGYFETVADKSPFGQRSDYHAVSVVFRVVIDSGQRISLDSQHVKWKWSHDLPPGFDIHSFQGRS